MNTHRKANSLYSDEILKTLKNHKPRKSYTKTLSLESSAPTNRFEASQIPSGKYNLGEYREELKRADNRRKHIEHKIKKIHDDEWTQAKRRYKNNIQAEERSYRKYINNNENHFKHLLQKKHKDAEKQLRKFKEEDFQANKVAKSILKQQESINKQDNLHREIAKSQLLNKIKSEQYQLRKKDRVEKCKHDLEATQLAKLIRKTEALRSQKEASYEASLGCLSSLKQVYSQRDRNHI